jgi:hypothetical protein
MTKIKIEEKILLEKNWLGLFRFIFNYFMFWPNIFFLIYSEIVGLFQEFNFV